MFSSEQFKDHFICKQQMCLLKEAKAQCSMALLTDIPGNISTPLPGVDTKI